MRVRRSTVRTGMTLPELLVVISIIGLLISLTLPAIQQSREAGRRMSCLTHLKQLGIALHSYQSVHNMFPLPFNLRNPRIYPGHHQYSAFTRMLPFLDQQSLYHSFNFSVDLYDPYLFPDAMTALGTEAIRTVMSTSLYTLLCPSDEMPRGGWTGNTNYRINLGAERWSWPPDSPFWQGFGGTTPARIRDGLSQTAAFAEKLVGSTGSSSKDPRRAMFVAALGIHDSVDESLNHCRSNITDQTLSYDGAGLTWCVGSLSQTCYNHTFRPNELVPDCILPLSNTIAGHIAARSNHQNGINIGMCDGSARFVKDSIDLRVWRALGTSNGGEIVPQDAY